MSRPEHINPPEIFYNATEAKKYGKSSRMLQIQTRMASRAMELLMLPEGPGKMILDIGCGTGLSGQACEKAGHFVVGMDISQDMLEVGRDRGVHKGMQDTFKADMGSGLLFREGTFDGIISISALQWLCNADASNINPVKRIKRFYNSLFACMVRGARAVFQFYPENPQQMELLTSSAIQAGFTGGVLVDYPNSAKAKKYFLVLMAGHVPGAPKPQALTGADNEVRFESERRRERHRRRGSRPGVKSKEWILNKKERRKRQGKNTRGHSKYTGQQRKPKF